MFNSISNISSRGFSEDTVQKHHSCQGWLLAQNPSDSPLATPSVSTNCCSARSLHTGCMIQQPIFVFLEILSANKRVHCCCGPSFVSCACVEALQLVFPVCTDQAAASFNQYNVVTTCSLIRFIFTSCVSLTSPSSEVLVIH